MPDVATGNPTPLASPPPRSVNLDAALSSMSSSPTDISGALQQKQTERKFLIGQTLQTIDREKELSQEERNIQAPTLTPEQMEHYTHPPKEQHTDPLNAFGSAAMMLAVFGSMFTRQPLLNSLNAAGKVLGAYKQGDDQAAQQAFGEWKAATDAALKLHQIQNDAYHDALARIGENKRENWAELQALAASFKDDTFRDLIAAGQFDLAKQHAKVMQEQVDILKDKSHDLEDKYFFTQEAIDAYRNLKTGQTELLAARQKNDENGIAAANVKIASATQQLRDVHEATGKEKDLTSIGGTSPTAQQTRDILEQRAKETGKTVEELESDPAERLKARREAVVQLGEAKPSASQQRAEEKRADTADTIDSTLRMVDQVIGGPNKPSLIGAWSTGAGGEAAKIAQGVAGVAGVDLGTQQAQFAQHAEMVQAAIRNELIKSHYMSKGAIEQLDEIVPGLGLLDDPVSTRQRWEHLKNILGEERDRLRGAPGGNKGRAAPAGTKDDPLMPSSPTEVDSIPAGKIYIDPRDPANLRVK